MQIFKSMKKFTIIVTSIVLSLFFTTCKKYPDGGNNFRAYQKILGYYRLALYEVNGIDSTNLINYNNNEDYKEIWIRESDVKTNSGFNITALKPGLSFGGATIFEDKKKKILVHPSYKGFGNSCSANQSFFPKCCRLIFYPEGQNTYWVIEKLTRKELVLSCQLTNAYKIKLKK